MAVFTNKNGARVLFVHIPKTGGSSVKKYMRESGWTEAEIAPKSYENIRHGRGVQYGHATWEVHEKWGHFDYRFTVVRDPVDRFKSEIFHMWSDAQTKKVIRDLFGGYPCWLITDNVLQEFINKVKKDPQIFGNHIRPQSDFLKPDSSVNVFRFPESITEVPITLNAIFGTPLVGNSVDHLKRGGPLKFKPSFTKTQKHIIKDYYKEDYKRFFRTD